MIKKILFVIVILFVLNILSKFVLQYLVEIKLSRVRNIYKDLVYQPYVSLGKPFKLHKGETSFLENSNIGVHLIDFHFVDCSKPESACDWGGSNYDYEVIYNDEIYDEYDANKLDIDVNLISTDYKSYAVFTLNKPETRCESKTDVSAAECWRSLANRFKKTSYCEKIITSKETKEVCYEELAKNLDQPALCLNVTSPVQYCGYLYALKKNDINLCKIIITRADVNKCYVEIAKNSGQDVTICSTLEERHKYNCLEAFKSKGE